MIDRERKFSFWGPGVSGGPGAGGTFLDCATFRDRGLNVRSTVLYLRNAHSARIPYLRAADSGGDRWVTEGPCAPNGLATDGHRGVTDWSCPSPGLAADADGRVAGPTPVSSDPPGPPRTPFGVGPTPAGGGVPAAGTRGQLLSRRTGMGAPPAPG